MMTSTYPCQSKFVQLASLVRERSSKWSLSVPTDPSDEEWIIRLDSVEVVADRLDVALDLAIAELQSC